MCTWLLTCSAGLLTPLVGAPPPRSTAPAADATAMARVGCDPRVPFAVQGLSKIGDAQWFKHHDADKFKDERLHGTISRAVATQKWAVVLDYGGSQVIMTSRQLEKEPATVGTCET